MGCGYLTCNYRGVWLLAFFFFMYWERFYGVVGFGEVFVWLEELFRFGRVRYVLVEFGRY